MPERNMGIGPEIGIRVRNLREERRLTQADLARTSGIPQATLSRIEHGGFKDIKGGTLIRLADTLRTTTDFLLGRMPEENPRIMAGADLGTRTLLKLYFSLGTRQKQMLEYFAEFLTSKQMEHIQHHA